MSIYIINSLYIPHMNSIGFASPEDPATERVSGVIFPLTASVLIQTLLISNTNNSSKTDLSVFSLR